MIGFPVVESLTDDVDDRLGHGSADTGGESSPEPSGLVVKRLDCLFFLKANYNHVKGKEGRNSGNEAGAQLQIWLAF